jgi:hypothetical protein
MRKMPGILACIVLAGCAGTPAPGPAPHARVVTGAATVTTVLEDFDQGPAEMQLSKVVSTWGPRVRDGAGVVDIVDAGQGGTGTAAQFRFEATFDKPFAYDTWKDSGLAFSGRAALGAPGAGTAVVAFSLLPHGFTLANVYLVQEVYGEEKSSLRERRRMEDVAHPLLGLRAVGGRVCLRPVEARPPGRGDPLR